MQPAEFFALAIDSAKEAEHIWPEYAACEAALESGWGESKLAKKAANLFGQKQGFTTQDLPIIDIGTDEVINGHVEHLSKCQWPMFPDWTTCFRARMELLQRSKLYAKALAATSGEEFVREVSKVWATDPRRADKVLSIFRKHIE